MLTHHASQGRCQLGHVVGSEEEQILKQGNRNYWIPSSSYKNVTFKRLSLNLIPMLEIEMEIYERHWTIEVSGKKVGWKCASFIKSIPTVSYQGAKGHDIRGNLQWELWIPDVRHRREEARAGFPANIKLVQVCIQVIAEGRSSDGRIVPASDLYCSVRTWWTGWTWLQTVSRIVTTQYRFCLL